MSCPGNGCHHCCDEMLFGLPNPTQESGGRYHLLRLKHAMLPTAAKRWLTFHAGGGRHEPQDWDAATVNAESGAQIGGKGRVDLLNDTAENCVETGKNGRPIRALIDNDHSGHDDHEEHSQCPDLFKGTAAQIRSMGIRV